MLDRNAKSNGLCKGAEMLRLDFGGARSVCLGMPRSTELDHETRELVVRLLTRAGTMMEDASVLALLAPAGQRQLLNTISKLEEASSAIGALIGAAQILVAHE